MILGFSTVDLRHWAPLARLVEERGYRRAWDRDAVYVPWGWRV